MRFHSASLRVSCVLSVLPVLALASASLADTFAVDAKASYLQGDSSTPPVIIDLSALSFPVSVGTTLELQRVGFFEQSIGQPDDSTTIGGVFSSSNTLLAPTILHRVPGAIDAGPDNNSGSSNITEDFGIDVYPQGTAPTITTMYVQVPAGAQFLFVGVLDFVYSDNSDPNHDLAVRVLPTPEPGSLMILGLGGAALLLRKRTRKE